MAIKIPTLTPKGFVEAVSDKADAAMMNFYVSQYSQTNMYRDSNRPLAYLVQQDGNDSVAIRETVEIELTKYLNRLFDYANVEVTVEEEGKGIKLQLDVMIREDGKEYSFGHEIKTANSKIVDIIDINNSGSLIHRNATIFDN